MEHRVRGAVITVEGHPDAPGIDKLDPVGAGTAKLQVGVAEHDPRLGDSGEERILIVGGTGQKRVHVGRGGGVAEADPADDGLFGESAERVRGLGADGLAARCDGGAEHVVVREIIRKRGPAVDVTADHRGALNFGDTLERLGRPRPEQRVVAAEDEPLDPRSRRVLEHRVERRQIAVDVVHDRDHVKFSNSIEEMLVRGTSFSLRYATAADTEALFTLGSDPDVTRFFSWGPYTSLQEPAHYIAGLPAERDRGERLDLLIVDHADRVLGVTGLSELSRRDRRAVVGTWLGRPFWGSGANRGAKGLIAALAFGTLGLERLGAYADVDNPRSQAALARIGFQREGVLRHWHRHGEAVHDVIVYSWLRSEWERSDLARAEAEIVGAVPEAFRVSAPPLLPAEAADGKRDTEGRPAGDDPE